jgi:hypothetical protein
MIDKIKKIWSNKFIRDRIFALTFLVLMFACFWHAYHAQSDFQKAIGIFPGILCLLSIFGLVFEDFKPGEEDDNDKK